LSGRDALYLGAGLIPIIGLEVVLLEFLELNRFAVGRLPVAYGD
jgi:hypothetical protein